jgi:hypothetical protein
MYLYYSSDLFVLSRKLCLFYIINVQVASGLYSNHNLCAIIFSMQGDVPLTYSEVCPLNVKVLFERFSKYKFKTLFVN